MNQDCEEMKRGISDQNSNPPALDLTYAYDFQKERYKNFWNMSLPVKSKLESVTLDNAWALPYKAAKGKIWGDGGILDERKIPIQASWVNHYMTGKYECDWANAKQLLGEYIYLGGIVNHWGHFFEDCANRLYLRRNREEAKFFYLGPIGAQIGLESLFPNIQRFLKLLGLDESNLIIVTEPTQIERVIIPEECFKVRTHTSPQFIQTFADVAANSVTGVQNCPEKIFFSRSAWNVEKNKEFGLELIDDTFRKAGFYIIYPENETLDDLIYYIQHSKEIAIIFGSAAYNLAFANLNKKKIYLINKTYLNGDGIYAFIKFGCREAVFLDFYAVKYPTSHGAGPFLFIRNSLMKKFHDDYGLKVNKELLSEEYLAENLLRYNMRFMQNPFILKRSCVMLSADDKKANYYSPIYAELWARECAPVEFKYLKTLPSSSTLPDLAIQLAGQREIIKKLLSTHAEDNLLIYSTHHSQLGWLEESVAGLPIGYPGGYKIEAIKLRLRKGKGVSYSVFYDGEGWTEGAHDGEMAGTTGKGKRIQGIRINAAADINIEFEYRIFTDEWSRWAKSGEELLAPSGLSSFEVRCAGLLRPQSSLMAAPSEEVLAETSANPEKLIKALSRSGCFQPDYYLESNPDVAKAGMDPLIHYAIFGWRERRRPTSWFDVDAYLKSHADINCSASYLI